MVSMFVKIAKLRFAKKEVKKREVTWNFGESPPTIRSTIYGAVWYVLWLLWKNCKDSCTPEKILN